MELCLGVAAGIMFYRCVPDETSVSLNDALLCEHADRF